MRPIDHIQRYQPGTKVKKTAENPQRRESGTGRKGRPDSKMPKERKPDGDHLVDELA